MRTDALKEGLSLIGPDARDELRHRLRNFLQVVYASAEARSFDDITGAVSEMEGELRRLGL